MTELLNSPEGLKRVRSESRSIKTGANKRYFYEYYLHISGKRLSDTLRVQNANYLFKKYWKLSWYYVMNFSNYNLKKRTGYERQKLLTFKIRGSNLLENNFCCCLETSRFPTIPFLSSSCQSSSRKYRYNFSARIKPEGLFLFFPFFFFFFARNSFLLKINYQ